jgi:hypothetical protein
MLVLFVGILMKFLDFSEREMDQSIAHFDKDLVVAQNEQNADVLA